MNFRRIARLVRKEFLQLRRDPRLLRMVIITPIFQLIIFGYAVSTDIKHIGTAVYDEDRTAASRELIDNFIQSRYFEFRRYLSSPEEINQVMDNSQAQIVLHIPRHFSKDLARNRAASVQMILDGSDSMTASIIAGYAGGVVRRYAAGISLARFDRLKGQLPQVPRVEGRLRVWYNPELKSVNFMVPAVLCQLLLVITMIMTSVAIVKEREIGTLEQLVVTPIKARELILGKSIPFVLIGFVDMLLVMLVAVYWFKVPIYGNILLLFALTAVFLFTSLGLGLFISTISHTQQQASMSSFFLMMPSILLSGFMFPIANMPQIIQYITYLIPLRYFLVIVRGIFLKGNTAAELWPQIIPLAALGIAIMLLSSLRFRKRLG
jgi:ABC-2 type transport system permease protein